MSGYVTGPVPGPRIFRVDLVIRVEAHRPPKTGEVIQVHLGPTSEPQYRGLLVPVADDAKVVSAEVRGVRPVVMDATYDPDSGLYRIKKPLYDLDLEYVRETPDD